MKKTKNKLIFLIVYLAYSSIYVARLNLSMAGPALTDLGKLDLLQLGMLGSVFSTTFALGRLINGSLSDRRPPWMMLTVGLSAAGLSNLLFGLFPPFAGMFLLWTSNAYAQSMLWSAVLCVVASICSDQEEAKRKNAVMITSVAMGNILGIVINTWLITRYSPRYAFFVPGVLTMVLGAAVMVLTRHIPAQGAASGGHLSMTRLMKDRRVLTMSGPAMFHGVMKENVSLWMTVYIVDRYCIDLSRSSYYILLIPVIGFVGRLLYPWVYQLCRERENRVSQLSFGVCLLSAAALCTNRLPTLGAVLCLSLIYAAVSMVNTSILSIFPLHYLKTGNVASVSGLMDFMIYLGAGIASAIYGVVIRQYGYLPMFVSWAVLSVLSMLALHQAEKQSIL